MKPGNFSFEEILHDIKYRINPDLKINDIELDNTGKRIKIYNLQGLLYITIQGLEEMITFYKNIPANEIVREFVKEMVNIYKAEETSNDNEIINLELCRIDHLTDHLFNLICKKYNDVSKVEDESIFGRIDISHCKVNLNNECPFEQPWVPGDINSIMNNVYSANDFLDMPKPCEEDLNKKYMGRGRSRIKQINIKDRPFICEYPECKRAFKRFEHLKRHNKMHTGERPYKCNYPGCMKSFSRSDNLAQHFKIHNVSSKPQSLTFRNYYETNKHLE